MELIKIDGLINKYGCIVNNQSDLEESLGGYGVKSKQILKLIRNPVNNLRREAPKKPVRLGMN